MGSRVPRRRNCLVYELGLCSQFASSEHPIFMAGLLPQPSRELRQLGVKVAALSEVRRAGSSMVTPATGWVGAMSHHLTNLQLASVLWHETKA